MSKNYLTSILASGMLDRCTPIGCVLVPSTIEVKELNEVENLINTINNSLILDELEDNYNIDLTNLIEVDLEACKRIHLLPGDNLYIVEMGVPIPRDVDRLPDNTVLTVRKIQVKKLTDKIISALTE